MKATCPACGAVFSLDALLGHQGAREAVMAAMEMPAPLGWHLIRYFALFRPEERQLSMDRLANLLNELLPMIKDAKIERNKRIWSAPLDYWRMALEEMISKRDSLTLPLKSHGYLLAIIEGYSSKAEAKQEARTEAQRGGHTDIGGVIAQAKALATDMNQFADKIGAKPRKPMPAHVKAVLKGGTDGNQ